MRADPSSRGFLLRVYVSLRVTKRNSSPLRLQLLGRRGQTTKKYSYVNWTVHHLDSWVKRNQLDATCIIIILFSAQHVSDVNTSILRSLRLIRSYFMGCIWFRVFWRSVSVWLWWCGIFMQSEALRMDVLTSETCWALNKIIIIQVASSCFSLLNYKKII